MDERFPTVIAEPQGSVRKRRHHTNSPLSVHVLPKAVMCVCEKRFIVGNSIACAIYCDSRIATTLYSVGTWFVYGVT